MDGEAGLVDAADLAEPVGAQVIDRLEPAARGAAHASTGRGVRAGEIRLRNAVRPPSGSGSAGRGCSRWPRRAVPAGTASSSGSVPAARRAVRSQRSIGASAPGPGNGQNQPWPQLAALTYSRACTGSATGAVAADKREPGAARPAELARRAVRSSAGPTAAGSGSLLATLPGRAYTDPEVFTREQ